MARRRVKHFVNVKKHKKQDGMGWLATNLQLCRFRHFWSGTCWPLQPPDPLGHHPAPRPAPILLSADWGGWTSCRRRIQKDRPQGAARR